MGGDDALLSARLTAGDERALAEVFDRFAPAVYGAALGVLGEETAARAIIQDVLVDLWRRPGQYDPAAATLHAYLVTVARKRAADLAPGDKLAAERRVPSPAEQVTATQADSDAVGNHA